MITASLNNYRHSPRKVRVVADTVRGKDVTKALEILMFLNKKATTPLYALLMSAVANAKNNFNIDKDTLFVKEIRVDAGVTLKRRMPRARGSAFPINKRSSHVLITLAPIAEKPVRGKKAMKRDAKADKSVKKELAAAKVEKNNK